ncbi:MAG TPA: FAD-dependent oxidoreductase [Acidimicrobiales bacterium]|nr:FAD-dependent oxidoreductase [Acidimicrobiales bacterium]
MPDLLRDPRAPLPVDGTVVVVGASLAGWRAAEALRAEGFAGRLVMVGEERHPPYDRPPLSKQVLAGTWPPERATLAPPEKLGELGIDAVLGHRAVSLDVEGRRVVLDDGSVLAADGIVVATGAAPRRVPGLDGSAAGVLRTLDEAVELRRRLVAAGPGCRVVVVGAGFIGSEVASSCAGLGCSVTVVELLATPLAPVVGTTVGAALADLHARHGVTLRTGVGVVGARPAEGEGPVALQLSDGTALEADVVVAGVGVVPATAWLEGSGLAIDDGVVCDASLFAADGVVAAGDLARWRLAQHGADEAVRVEHWQLAAEAGVAAARSLLAGRAGAAPFVPVPYFWSDQYGSRIQMLGRPSPDDDLEVVDGSLAEDRFVVLYGRRGRLTGVLGVGRPRVLMSFRPLLAAGGSFDEALALGRG